MKITDFGILTSSEERLVNHIKSGSPKLLRLGPVFPEVLTFNSTSIRADILQGLILGRFEGIPEYTNHLQIENARVYRSLNLFGATINIDISFVRSIFYDKIVLQNATTRDVSIRLSTLHQGLAADAINVIGSVTISGTESMGTVSMRGAHIRGILDCRGSISKVKGLSFTADRLDVDGGVFFEKSTSLGWIVFTGAKIGGDLGFQLSKISGFAGDKVTIGGDAYMDNLRATREIRFIGATIGGNLSFLNSKLEKLIPVNPSQEDIDRYVESNFTTYLPENTDKIINEVNEIINESSLNCTRAEIRGGWMWRGGS